MDEIEGAEQGAQARRFMETSVENAYLRAENKHFFRLGVMQIEVLPVGATDIPELFAEFSKLARLLKELHGDKHLVATFDIGEQPKEKDIVEEMFQ
tara:strand:- start:886 stop:1173 length:288 start_codon:yes stop_codon:yes gene_type:complete